MAGYLDSSKATIAASVFFHGFAELGFAEVGPKGMGYVNFSVRDLPKEEIAYTHFTAGANENIRVRHFMCIEVVIDQCFVNVIGGNFAGLYTLRNFADGGDNFFATAVAERKNKC